MSEATSMAARAPWPERARTWFDVATTDLARTRRMAFEAQLVLSALSCINSSAHYQVQYFDPDTVLPMQLLLLGWAALHPVFFWAGRRFQAHRVHLLFLLLAAVVLNIAFAQMREVWLEQAGVRLAYLGTLMITGFVLLPMRECVVLLVAVVALHVGWLFRSIAHHTQEPAHALVALVLPVIACAMILSLGAYLLERLHLRMREFQDRLALQNAQLESEVKARAAIIEQQQEQLLQAQKLEAVGTLAAGVAHDFNNLLAIILGFTRELKLYAEPGDPVAKAAAVIDHSARRATDLTQRLLGFAQQGKVLDVPVDLHAAIDDVLRLVERNLGTAIEVETRLAADAPFFLGDPVQVQQVLVNLVLNARDAMPSGGRLTLSTRAEVQGGDRWLVLEVRDTGTGIPQEIRGRIFDPFFTKRPGAGLGLGLAMVYGIVKSHHGEIAVESEPGLGAVFRLRLPATDHAPSQPTRTPAAPPEGPGVLVVLSDRDVLLGLGQRVRALVGAQSQAVEADWLDAREYVKANAARLELIVFDRGR